MSRPTRVKDMRGERFGRLTVGEYVGLDSRRGAVWNCECDCGASKPISRSALVSGDTVSCGCFHKEVAAKVGRTTGLRRVTHGHKVRNKASATYQSWMSMRGRCERLTDPSYPEYGGVGVGVCERWQIFENFLADMGERPSGTSIDRIDLTGNYCPENCRWATAKEQAENRRTTHWVEYRGAQLSIADFARVLGMKEVTVRARILRGWSAEQVASTPVRRAA